ncbi:hypothetical protein [Cellulomonas persica]|uniref:Uncharacterized protein n=1 Tax=Cellulomonas persica TaxID=76861 RepID=A0A510UWU6_9CELL|nr:hypothetical protein [Cellulomonas persica]GEK17265.1 hypothetical protein CPE01_09980 [Cellulomonas persica]
MKHTAVGELNARTGLGSAVSALSKLVLSLNILVAVAGAVVFFGDRYWPGFSVPSAFEDYQGGLVGAVSASYIIVLNAAYDRYYEAYARATELTTVGHSIDVGVKVGLVVATIVVQAEPATIVLVTLLLYCLDLVRLWELARSTDSENPIHRPLVKVWIPNCRRHTYRLVLLLVTQVLIATGAIYAIAHWVVPSTDVPTAAEVEHFTELNLIVFDVWFALYLIVRVQTKSIVVRHRIFSQRGLRDLDDAVDKYYERD